MIFSVLIPAYNVEKYIDKCLLSIKKQLFVDFEVIIIDDGSTDQTLSICKEYELNDDRFTVYHQQNKGIAYTRNKLLELASGMWIIFVDADDYVKDDYLLSFYRCQKRNESADVLVSDYMIWKGGDKYISVHEAFKGKKEYLIKLLSWRGTCTALWAKAIRRNLIRNHTFKFEDKITLGEDLCFMSRLFYYANDILYLPVESYVWNNTNVDSITSSGKYRSDYIPLYEEIFLFYRDKADYALFSKVLNNTIVRAIEVIYLYGHELNFGRLPSLIDKNSLTIVNRIKYFCCLNNFYKSARLIEKIVRRCRI